MHVHIPAPASLKSAVTIRYYCAAKPLAPATTHYRPPPPPSNPPTATSSLRSRAARRLRDARLPLPLARRAPRPRSRRQVLARRQGRLQVPRAPGQVGRAACRVAQGASAGALAQGGCARTVAREPRRREQVGLEGGAAPAEGARHGGLRRRADFLRRVALFGGGGPAHAANGGRARRGARAVPDAWRRAARAKQRRAPLRRGLRAPLPRPLLADRPRRLRRRRAAQVRPRVQARRPRACAARRCALCEWLRMRARGEGGGGGATLANPAPPLCANSLHRDVAALRILSSLLPRPSSFSILLLNRRTPPPSR